LHEKGTAEKTEKQVKRRRADKDAKEAAIANGEEPPKKIKKEAKMAVKKEAAVKKERVQAPSEASINNEKRPRDEPEPAPPKVAKLPPPSPSCRRWPRTAGVRMGGDALLGEGLQIVRYELAVETCPAI